jgi:hypothetical protein
LLQLVAEKHVPIKNGFKHGVTLVSLEVKWETGIRHKPPNRAAGSGQGKTLKL